MIITRYKLHKITGINESVFSQMWKRHLSGKDFYSFFTEDGKVDISDNGFKLKYSAKIIPEELQKLEDKLKPKIKPVVEKKVVTKKAINKKVVTKKTPPKEPKITIPKDEPIPEKDEELSALARKATIAKHKNEIFKSEKAELDLRKSRAEVAEIETLGRVLIGYCIALNQNILDQPRSFIDELTAGIKAGKSKTDLTDMARKPAMESISEAIEMINKEIARYKRDIQKDNK